MYSFQGKHYAYYQDVPASILSAFMEQSVLTETIRVNNGQLLFWEEHYLRLMASMRNSAYGNSHDLHPCVFGKSIARILYESSPQPLLMAL